MSHVLSEPKNLRCFGCQILEIENLRAFRDFGA
jgi:hypothetical protein